MKGFLRGEGVYICALLFIINIFILSVFRTKPVNIVEPITQVRAGRSAQLDFTVNKSGSYQFSLLLNKGYFKQGDKEQAERNKLFGDINNKGEVIPVLLRLFKDGKLFSEEKIETMGTVREHAFYRKEYNLHTTVRNIKIAELPHGHYAAEITLLKDLPDFDGIPVYTNVIYYTPKNLARVAEESRAMDKKMDSFWFNGWLLTKFWVKGLWCVKFCAAPLRLYRTLDISHAGQVTTIDFDIFKDENYRFVLTLGKGDSYGNFRKRTESVGDNFGSGVPVVISLRVIKDGKVYYETITRTISHNSSYYICDDEGKGKIDVVERTVEGIGLQSGHYKVIFTVLNNNPDLTGVAAFAGVRYSKMQGKYVL
ncbi:DUF5625 family protein [Erwinia billingiae]|uniref:DUF5625 family protein n=1 Tax=Erwinia billingiae TaxID=182337 RepID=UPI0022478203|nr:DUF5625 family protein [Erwinia billingiae]MCX0498454.1 hypothetical protein [Erwinia billingiae]